MRRRQRRRTPDLPNAVLKMGPLVSDGRCLAHLDDGRVCLVAFAAPGETVEVRFEAEHPDYLEAVVERVIEPSPDRVEPRCRYFGECGGCQLQHMSYEAQLEAKRAVVCEQLRRIGHLDGLEVRLTVGMDDPWGYRNHVRFSTGSRYGDLGFVPRARRGLLRIDECPIAHPEADRVLHALQGFGRGLHQVQVRYSPPTGSTLITPAISGAPLATGQTEYVEELGGRRFRVSASSFFQVNAEQAEQLTRLVDAELPERGDLLVDAYAGVGTFAVIFAGRFDRVVAIEESPSAIADARANIEGYANIELHKGKVEHVLPGLSIRPDVVLLDPARPGCAPEVLEAIRAMAPPVVVYVSCNPATLARDLRVMVEGGYDVAHVTPVDMFPQTAHIESVTRLDRR